MKDIMLDLETMDTVASAAIVAIGAVHCDLTTGEIGSTYYRAVELKYQKGTIFGETLYWWLDQSDAARQALLVEGKLTVPQLCDNFNKWLKSLGEPLEHLRLWGNGASFDNATLRYIYRQYEKELPIKFWNDRDMRTVLGFYPRKLQEEWRNNNRRKGDHHNALADAKHQVKYCSDILKDLGVTELF